MKIKGIIMSLLVTAILSLNIFSFSLLDTNTIDPQPTTPNGGVVVLGIDPDPIRE